MIASALAGCLGGSDDDGGDDDVMGCTYADALNYDASATIDDGGCLYDCDGGGGDSCPADLTGDGVVGVVVSSSSLSIKLLFRKILCYIYNKSDDI